MTDSPKSFKDEQIKYMVKRFLGWRLPEHFNPDCGIKFDADGAKKLHPNNHRYEPIGTNLFDADQAEGMIRYMLDGLPPIVTTRESGGASKPTESDAIKWQHIDKAIKDGRTYLMWDGEHLYRAWWGKFIRTENGDAFGISAEEQHECTDGWRYSRTAIPVASPPILFIEIEDPRLYKHAPANSQKGDVLISAVDGKTHSHVVTDAQLKGSSNKKSGESE